jgi:hypothetical protein
MVSWLPDEGRQKLLVDFVAGFTMDSRIASGNGEMGGEAELDRNGGAGTDGLSTECLWRNE